MMSVEFLILFCRWNIGFLFLYSSLAKILSTESFQQTVKNLKILPKLLIKPFSFAIIFVEFLLAIIVISSKSYFRYAFLFSSFLLILFTIMFLFVLSQKKLITCNCFGKTQKLISWFDIIRNLVFICISVLGYILSYHLKVYQSSVISFSYETFLCGFISIILILVATNLEDFAKLLS